MKRERCGYLVRALYELASLTAQCSFDDVDCLVGTKTQSRIEGCPRKSSKVAQRRRARYRNRHARSKIDRANTAVCAPWETSRAVNVIEDQRACPNIPRLN